MPGCILRVSGASFDVDGFLAVERPGWRVVKRWRVGDSRPRRAPSADAGFNAVLSDANGDDALSAQLRDAVSFLEENRKDLAELRERWHAETFELDFGIAARDVAVQVDRLPAELVRLAGPLNCDLCISRYPMRP